MQQARDLAASVGGPSANYVHFSSAAVETILGDYQAAHRWLQQSHASNFGLWLGLAPVVAHLVGRHEEAVQRADEMRARFDEIDEFARPYTWRQSLGVAPLVYAAAGRTDGDRSLLRGAFLDIEPNLYQLEVAVTISAALAAVTGDLPRASRLFAWVSAQNIRTRPVVDSPAAWALYRHYTARRGHAAGRAAPVAHGRCGDVGGGGHRDVARGHLMDITSEPVRGAGYPPGRGVELPGLDRMRGLVDGSIPAPPFMRLFGLRVTHVSSGSATATMPASP